MTKTFYQELKQMTTDIVHLQKAYDNATSDDCREIIGKLLKNLKHEIREFNPQTKDVLDDNVHYYIRNNSKITFITFIADSYEDAQSFIKICYVNSNTNYFKVTLKYDWLFYAVVIDNI